MYRFVNKESVLGLNLELNEAQELWSNDSQSLWLGKSSTHLPKTVVWSWPSSGGLTAPGLSSPPLSGPHCLPLVLANLTSLAFDGNLQLPIFSQMETTLLCLMPVFLFFPFSFCPSRTQPLDPLPVMLDS